MRARQCIGRLLPNRREAVDERLPRSRLAGTIVP